jgi:CubicO group peptidase (beta-lactamase class C family)
MGSTPGKLRASTLAVLILASLAAPTLCRAASAQTGTTPESALVGVDADIERAMTGLHVPGASVGVIQNGKVILAKGYGIRDIASNDPVDADTVFTIGSMTKSFTATAAAAMMDDGKLDWDKPVVNYLPWFRLYDPVATQLITPRDLLSHRSGLPSHDFIRISTYMTREDLLHRIRFLEPNLTFRQAYEYNSLMYTVAGYLAGYVNESSWEALVRQRIFLPLGMNSSSTSIAEMQRSKNFAHPHTLVDGRVVTTYFYDQQRFGMGPSGSVNSSINDMLKYLAFHLSDGKVEGHQVISTAQMREMHKETVIIGDSTDYALGWIVSSYHGHRVLEHSGAVNGFTSYVILLPEDKIGIVVLNNLASPLPRTITSDLRDRLMGIPPGDYLEKVLANETDEDRREKQARAKLEEARIPNTKTTLPLAEYAGIYFHPAYGKIHVTVDGDGLKVQFDAYQLDLKHYHHDTFSYDAPPGRPNLAQFQIGESGKVSALLLPLEPSVKPLTFVKGSQ